MTAREFFISPQRDYSNERLTRSSLGPDPIAVFGRWFEEASQRDPVDAHSMVLATADDRGRPSARVVLLKQADQGGFVFFTNYASRKARELEANPVAALVFYWSHLDRQVRVEGRVERVSVSESDDYFATRPRDSQIAAAVSPQSRVIRDRQWLEEAHRRLAKEVGDGSPERPPEWGGFRLFPSAIEFWQGRPSRLHDRILCTRREDGSWKMERLGP